MNIEIFSRDELIRRSRNPWQDDTALISICDSNDVPPLLTFYPKYKLYLSFDDIYVDEIDEIDKENFKLFDNNQAKKICNFVFEHKPLINTLVCQCEFGQSRSAAIAAAVKEFYFKNGIEIFADEKYCPNKTVYNLLIEELKKGPLTDK